MKSIVKIFDKLGSLPLAQPSYFFGFSITKLMAFKMVQAMLLLRRKGPSRSLISDLKAQKESKRGQIALVLGNGPSINTLDVSNVLEFKPDIFVTNAYYSSAWSHVIKPDFYCLSDPSFFFNHGGVVHNITDTLNYIQESECTLLISHLYRGVKIPLKNRVVYFNDLDASVFTKNIDPCKPRGYASQTIMKALSVAIYLGYDKIYLLGVDNTEHRALYGNQANEIWARTDIYYGTDENLRFDYRITTQSGITSAFHQYATWFADFKKFNVGNVYNLDENSLVDAFPKVRRITR